MARDGGEGSPPHLHGVVVITFPPPDNPSKGKTITAFTFPVPGHGPGPGPGPGHGSFPVPLPTHRPRFPFPAKAAVAGIFASALLALSLYLCLSTDLPSRLLAESSDFPRSHELESFVLPLYPKNRTAGPNVKLGSLTGLKMSHQKRAEVEGLSSGDVTTTTTNSSALLPLTGNVFPDGQYYTTIFVGHPPRPYFLDVDTGSELTWIQCDAPCTSCAKGPHPLYRPTKERLVDPADSLCLELQRDQNYKHCNPCQQCDYEIDYADHSSSLGVLARDDIHLINTNGELVKFTFAFGCAYDQQGQLLNSPAKTDGILGLSPTKVGLPSQLASQGIITNMVGHCISSKQFGSGYIFLGDGFVPQWGMTWVAALNDQLKFYSAEVLKMSYGKRQFSTLKTDENSVQLIFDTGTSFTYIPNEAYAQLLSFIKDIAHGLTMEDSDPSLPVCWRADFPIRSVKDVKRFFNPVELHFGGRLWLIDNVLTISPEDYLLINSKGNVCLGILNGSEVLDGSTILLGDISLRGKLVAYDNVRRRIGWMQSDCSKPQRQGSFPFLF